MPYNPTSIANYYIAKHGYYYDFDPENTIALTYLAHGWSTVFSKNGEPLIDEPVIAASFGGTFLSLSINIATAHYTPFEEKIINKLGNQKISKEDKILLDQTWRNYSRYRSNVMYDLAFPPNGPCAKAYKEGRGSISVEELRSHFLERKKHLLPVSVTQ